MMTNRYAAKIALATATGFGIGVLMLIIGLISERRPIFAKLVNIIHMPAWWAAHYWSYELELPPYHEAAFAVVPIVAVILQWTLLGLLIGIWRCFTSKHKT